LLKAFVQAQELSGRQNNRGDENKSAVHAGGYKA
jgi:hypothetical protein